MKYLDRLRAVRHAHQFLRAVRSESELDSQDWDSGAFRHCSSVPALHREWDSQGQRNSLGSGASRGECWLKERGAGKEAA